MKLVFYKIPRQNTYVKTSSSLEDIYYKYNVNLLQRYGKNFIIKMFTYIQNKPMFNTLRVGKDFPWTKEKLI